MLLFYLVMNPDAAPGVSMVATAMATAVKNGSVALLMVAVQIIREYSE